MHFHSHPSDPRTTPVVQLKETRTKETTAAKILSPLSFQTDDHRSMFNGVLPKEQAAPVPRAADPVPRSPPFHLRKFIHSLGSFYFFFLFFLLFRFVLNN